MGRAAQEFLWSRTSHLSKWAVPLNSPTASQGSPNSDLTTRNAFRLGHTAFWGLELPMEPHYTRQTSLKVEVRCPLELNCFTSSILLALQHAPWFFLVFPMGHEALATSMAQSGLGPRRTWLGPQEQVLVLGSTGTSGQY